MRPSEQRRLQDNILDEADTAREWLWEPCDNGTCPDCYPGPGAPGDQLEFKGLGFDYFGPYLAKMWTSRPSAPSGSGMRTTILPL